MLTTPVAVSAILAGSPAVPAMAALWGTVGKGAGAALPWSARRGGARWGVKGGSGAALRVGEACWGKVMMVRPRGLEPLTLGSATPRSIQLSYGRIRENASIWGSKRQADPLRPAGRKRDGRDPAWDASRGRDGRAWYRGGVLRQWKWRRHVRGGT